MANEKNQNKQIYTCPMHPEVQVDQPGTCPKCGMELVRQDKQQQSQTVINKTVLPKSVS